MSKVTIACPNCGNRGEVDESYLGRRAQCNKCKAAFVFEKVAEPTAAASTAPQPGAALSGESARRAEALLAGPPFDVQRVADPTHVQDIGKQWTELCTLAQESCRISGHQETATDIGRTQTSVGTIFSLWPALKPVLANTSPGAVVSYQMVMGAAWGSMLGVIQRFGLGHPPTGTGDTDSAVLELAHVLADKSTEFLQGLMNVS